MAKCHCVVKLLAKDVCTLKIARVAAVYDKPLLLTKEVRFLPRMPREVIEIETKLVISTRKMVFSIPPS